MYFVKHVQDYEGMNGVKAFTAKGLNFAYFTAYGWYHSIVVARNFFSSNLYFYDY